jgi:RNA-directed DNA polymerase
LELEKRGLLFVRYADDIAIFCASERSAGRVEASVIKWIERKLKLPVNRAKSGHGPGNGTARLGFRLETDGTIRIAPKSVERLKDRVRELWDARQSLKSEELRDQWQSCIRGWWGYFRLTGKAPGRDRPQRMDWAPHAQMLLTALAQSKRAPQCDRSDWGSEESTSAWPPSSKGAWAIARHWVMQRALKNRTLKRYGFTLPWETAAT